MNKLQSSNKLFINMTTYALLQVVNLLVGLFLPRLYLAVYGSEVNGVISTVNSFTSYFTYLEAGLGLTLIHALFKPLAEQNNAELNGILAYSQKKYRNISLLYFLLVILFSLIFPLIKDTQDIGYAEFSLLILVIGLFGALDFFTMSKYRVLLTADRKEYVISNAMTLAQACRFIFTWLLLTLEPSVVLVKTIPIFTLLLRSVILRLYIKKHYPSVDYSVTPEMTATETKGHWDALLLQISISTSVALPTILVSQILDYKEANVYAVYSLVISAMISITSSLSSGVSPMLGKSIAEGKDIKNTYRNFDFAVACIITIVFSVTSVMLLPFIELYTSVVDDVQYIHPLYAVLISLWGALYAYRIPVTAVINAAGIYRENRLHNIVNLIIQIIFGTVATLLFGIPGIATVMIISALHRNVVLTHQNNKSLLNDSLKKCILYQLVIITVIVISFLASYRLISSIQFTILGWINVAIAVTLIELVIGVVLFVAIDYKTAKSMLSCLKAKFSKK